MKKEVTIVPKDKCPLDILAELGERTAESWIFLHANAINKLRATCNREEESAASFTLRWDACEKYPETVLNISEAYIGCWYMVNTIFADDIAFKCHSYDPAEIFFLKMEG